MVDGRILRAIDQRLGQGGFFGREKRKPRTTEREEANPAPWQKIGLPVMIPLESFPPK